MVVGAHNTLYTAGPAVQWWGAQYNEAAGAAAKQINFLWFIGGQAGATDQLLATAQYTVLYMYSVLRASQT